MAPGLSSRVFAARSLHRSDKHSADARRILRNLTAMVTELPKLELQMRRSPGHNPSKVEAQLEKINFEINNLEQWVTLLLLY